MTTGWSLVRDENECVCKSAAGPGCRYIFCLSVSDINCNSIGFCWRMLLGLDNNWRHIARQTKKLFNCSLLIEDLRGTESGTAQSAVGWFLWLEFLLWFKGCTKHMQCSFWFYVVAGRSLFDHMISLKASWSGRCILCDNIWLLLRSLLLAFIVLNFVWGRSRDGLTILA